MPIFTPITRSSKGAPLTHNEMDQNLTGLARFLIPVGSIMIWATEDPPEDWLICNGSEVSRQTYPDLFEILGESYGPGNGATTFNLPDYRGVFMRGRDAGSERDPDVGTRTDRGDGTTGDAVGTRQEDEFKSHNHTLNVASGSGSLGPGGSSMQSPGTGPAYNINVTTVGGKETRPKNIYVNYVIKAL